jgi:hypothetical protein
LLLQIRKRGLGSITNQQKLFLQRAEVPLRKQIENSPPNNEPWSFFDLSTIYRLIGKKAAAIKVLKDSRKYITDGWQLTTHLETLQLVEGRMAGLPGWDQLVSILQENS